MKLVRCFRLMHYEVINLSQLRFEVPCKGGCKNGGICLGFHGCKCPAGYGGKRCEKGINVLFLPCFTVISD